MTVIPYIFITLLQLCVLLFLIAVLRRFLIFILKSKSFYKKYLYFFNVLVYFIWIVFVMLKVAHALNDNYLIVGSVVFIITLLMWDFLSNFFLGIIFAFQYGYLENKTIVVNQKQGKLINYSSSNIEVLTKKGKRLKIKYKEIFNGEFETFSSDLYRISRKIKIQSSADAKFYEASIMNHPVFLMNNSFYFEEKIDEKNQHWISFYFNVMNYKDANIINRFINQLSPKKN
tara:strand:+ start:364 stop:1053 length:690 start_codon:yes stop_codon:yes gene_type:complete